MNAADHETEIREIVDYLNKRTDSCFRPQNKETQKLIRGRLSEGFTVEDFKTVIDFKADQWMGDEKMEQYLQPSTLFRPSHFESYLSNALRARKSGLRSGPSSSQPVY